MTLFNKYLYPVLTLVFLTFALVAGGILLKQNQDLRRKAEGGCPSGQSCQLTCDANHPNRDSSECKCWGDAAHGNPGDAQNGSCVQPGITPVAPGGSGHMNCGAVPDGGSVYNSDTRCTYTCANGTYPSPAPGNCNISPPDPATTYLSNNSGLSAGPGQWTSNGTNATPNTTTTGPFANRSETCQVCTCTSLTNGECRSNCTMMPCSQAQTPSCGQVDLCPVGQPPEQCGAAAANRVVGTNCTNNTSTPTNPPQSTNTPIPTRTPTPTPTATNTSTPTPAKINCGASPCTINSCATGLVCVTTAGGVNYCSQSANQEACIANPSVGSCCQQPTNTPVPPTNTPNPTNTPVPPTGTPNSCNGTCGSDGNCQSGLTCYLGFCRNPNNPSDSGCNNKGEPNSCNGTCGSDTNCKSGLVCSSGYCRNPNNPTNVNCQEKTVAKGPTPTRIILPVSGNTTPLTGITIVGSIVTLLGILLIL